MCWGSGSLPMRTSDRCRSRHWRGIGRSLVKRRRRSWWSTTGGRLNPAPPAARVGRGQGCGHSAQGESAVVGCQGSPRSDSQRAGSDRGQHWDFEKQSIQVQQTEGASLAHAGDGGAEVYPLVQSEQIHAGFSGADPVRDRQQRLERNPNRERVQSQQEGMEARMTSNGILRHALVIWATSILEVCLMRSQPRSDLLYEPFRGTMKRNLIVAIVTLTLTACGTMVKARVSSFHNLPAQPSG